MTIRKVKAGYRLISKGGENLGTFRTKAQAENREKQVKRFSKRN